MKKKERIEGQNYSEKEAKIGEFLKQEEFIEIVLLRLVVVHYFNFYTVNFKCLI